MDVDELRTTFSDRDWQTVEDGTLRIAMVGLGGWTVNRAIPGVDSSQLCETTALVTSSTEKARSVARESASSLGDEDDATDVADDVATLTYDEFKDGEESDAYDAVYVATPNALHKEYVVAAADLGKAVLCEKPLEANVDRAAELVDGAADVPLMTAYRMQTEPTVRAMRALVRQGAIGDPVAVHGHMTQPVLDYGSPDQWRLDPDLAGYGSSVTDLGIYPLNTARFVLEADPVAVTARANSTHPAFDEVPDERASFTLEFPNEVRANCTASQNAHQSGSIRVIGSDGTIRLEPAFFGDERRELVVDLDGVQTRFAPDPIDQMCEEFDYFADRVLGDEPIEPDGEHALRDMQVIERIYAAADGDGWHPVTYRS